MGDRPDHVDAKATFTDDELERTQAMERMQQQCFLMDNWPSLCSPANPAITDGYKNITCIVGSPSDLVQKMTSRKGRSPFLMLTSDQLALLVPKIKLFKVPLQEDGTPKAGSGTEIRFRTHYDEKTITQITEQTRHRGNANGLKSLSYEFYDAGSTELAGRRQKIILTFFAESLAALAEGPTGTMGNAPLDLAIDSQRYYSEFDESGKPLGGEKFNSAYSAIKVVYGWSIPSEANKMFNKKERKSLAASTQTLLLSLTDHKLSFNENGSCELEIEYEGYVNTKLGEIERNILWPDPDNINAIERKRLAASKANQALAENAGDVEMARAAIKSNEPPDLGRWGNFKRGWDNRAFTGNFIKPMTFVGEHEGMAGHVFMNQATRQAEADAAQAVADNAVAVDKAAKYRRILDKLQNSGKVWSINIPMEDLGLRQTGGNSWYERDREFNTNMSAMRMTRATDEEFAAMDDNEKIEEEGRRHATAVAINRRRNRNLGQNAVGGQSHALGVGAEFINDELRASIMANTGQGGAKLDGHWGTDAEKSKSMRQEAGTNLSMNLQAKDASIEGEVTIEFMYFGDILSVLLESAYNGKTLPIKYLVGSFSFRDARTGYKEILNIADIPISLYLFMEFWMKHVVKPGLDTYTIKQFVTAAMTELIIASLGDDCYMGEKSNTNPAGMTLTVLSAPGKDGGKNRLEGRRINPDSVDIAASPRDDLLPDPANTEPKNLYNYLFLYCNAWTSANLNEDIEKDAERGIYWISVGQDRGPVKKVSFEKNDIPFQSTAAVMQMGSTLDRLAASYKANVTMVGNSLFMIGNYVYISPTSLGVNTSTALKLGLGGYHTVVKLNGKVDASGWTCDMECIPLFNSWVDRTRSRAGVIAAPENPSPAGNDPEAGSVTAD